MKARLKSLGLAAVAGLVLGLAASDASALTISNPTITPGNSQGKQNNPPGDLSSSLGYAVELDLLFEFGADATKCGSFATPVACSSTTGRVTATLKNVSLGVAGDDSNITNFGLSLLGNQADDPPGPNNAVAASGLFQGITEYLFDGTGCTIDGCNFADDSDADGNSPSDVQAFLSGNIDLGASNANTDDLKGAFETGITADGLGAQESAILSWIVFGDFTSLCTDANCTALAVSGTIWTSLIDPQLVQCSGTDCEDFNAFWVAHMQSLNISSDKIGGGTVTVIEPPPPGVPEPLTLALFGAGLIGLGALRRRFAA